MSPRKVSRFLKNKVHALVRTRGFDIVQYNPREFPPDFEAHHISIINAVQPYTMTPRERIFALIEAVHYVSRARIPGSIVECGVWRGGSMMAVALALKSMNIHDRELYLYDTFEGMPKPQDVDIDINARSAMATFAETQIAEDTSDYCRATLRDVREAMATTGYDKERIHFHRGKVEATIPSLAPDNIALLRLDTDWYQSTRHELEHLYPRLSIGGILIIDDYGHWRGSRKATDEYIAKHAPSLFLSRTDYSGRIAVKTA